MRLKMMVPGEQAAEEADADLHRIVAQTRTGVTPQVLVAGGRSFEGVLVESSADADLLLLGMASPDTVDGGEEGSVRYYESLIRRASALPTTVYVLAAEEIAFREVLLRTEQE